MGIQDWFDKYAEHHQNPINKAIHWVCVPSIFFSLIGILSLLSFNLGSEITPSYLNYYLHAGSLLILFGLLFFFRLSVPIALGMMVISLIILKGIAFMHRTGMDVAMVCISIFVVAWIGQFIGHKIEGAKPSFLDDLKFLLIGPAWLLSFVYKAIGVKY
ncbi:MAG: DUF962 domain-containing protein [Vicingaceae bacterium]